MERQLGANNSDGVLPLLRHAGHPSPPLGCDYRTYGQVASWCWPDVNRCLRAGGANAAFLLAWIDGALSGLNMALHDTFDISPFTSEVAMRALVIEASADNPHMPLHGVVLHVARSLVPFRARRDGPGVTLAAAGQSVRLRAASLRLLQTALASRGFLGRQLIGTDDAALLRAALLAFQHSEDLPLSGLPDPLTLARLTREPL